MFTRVIICYRAKRYVHIRVGVESIRMCSHRVIVAVQQLEDRVFVEVLVLVFDGDPVGNPAGERMQVDILLAVERTRHLTRSKQ